MRAFAKPHFGAATSLKCARDAVVRLSRRALFGCGTRRCAVGRHVRLLSLVGVKRKRPAFRQFLARLPPSHLTAQLLPIRQATLLEPFKKFFKKLLLLPLQSPSVRRGCVFKQQTVYAKIRRGSKATGARPTWSAVLTKHATLC